MKILSVEDLVKGLGMSRSTIYRKVRDGSFPAPKRMGENKIGWLESSVKEWFDALPTALDDPISAPVSDDGIWTGLPTQIASALKAQGFRSRSEVAMTRDVDLLKLPRIGVGSLQVIHEWVG